MTGRSLVGKKKPRTDDRSQNLASAIDSGSTSYPVKTSVILLFPTIHVLLPLQILRDDRCCVSLSATLLDTATHRGS